ncbi:ABC transporter substrate-binding protein [Flavobacterium psychrophilum]|nr:ABC transporter substrate-binding protein [Flavobacterium psychrophilum]EKT4517352.1 ABC transporter substrate-binding protein [Flavobacterium psychrophilum]
MKNIFLYILVLISSFAYSQENKLWKGYFSYNTIKDLSQSTNQIYSAAENAYFKKNLATNEITTVSTVEGLSGQNITQIYHSEIYKKTLIGHTDGLVIIINDLDGSVLNVVDILNKPSVPPNSKKINHFMEYNGKIYISTDFGISIYDLNLSEFGDTYFIGSGGSNIEILQTTIYNGFIYAVANGYGLLKATVTNPNLIDFNQWTNISPGSWKTIEATATQLIAVNLSGSIYKLINDNPNLITSYPQITLDTRHNSNHLIITTQNHIYIYNEQLIEVLHLTSIPNITANFTCATVINDKIYIGTQENGVFATSLNNPTFFENITPKGPDKNRIFAIQSFSNGLWAAYGDYDSNYNPYPIDSFSVSKYTTNNSWTSTPYQDLFGAKSICRIIVNPKNENQVYFSSNFSGLLKFENNLPSTLYDNSNSSLQKITINGYNAIDIRINGSVFDKDGNLWITNSLVSKGLHVLKTDNQWQGFALTSLVAPLALSYGRLTIDKNGTKWACTNYEGLIGFNEKYNNKCLSINVGQDHGNLPNKDVRAVAVDNKNKLWIGTKYGLRILQNVDSFLNQNELTTNAIIILEDGLAQELLYGQSITDIVVDGANNKWISTSGAGLFYISSDGQKTFNIFTKENSPLPSNTILDIDINSLTGEVFIATEAGMVSFKGTATNGAENFENVIVYPNPARPEYSGSIFITGLMNKANVKITDIEGNLVHEEISEGGTIIWDTKAFGKYKVASGVYMIFMSSSDGEETKVKKVMIVR